MDQIYYFHSAVGWIHGCESCRYKVQTVVKFLQSQKSHITEFSTAWGIGALNPHVVQGSTI